MKAVWIGTVEIGAKPGDLPSGFEKGFANITTLADSESEFKDKVSAGLAKFEWEVVSFQSAAPVDPRSVYDAVVRWTIEQAWANPSAIVLGRIHSYSER